MAPHSSVLAWRIPGTAEPGGLPSMGSHREGHDWSDLAAAAAAMKWPDGFGCPAWVWGGAGRFPGDLACTPEQRCRPALRARERRTGEIRKRPGEAASCVGLSPGAAGGPAGRGPNTVALCACAQSCPALPDSVDCWVPLSAGFLRQECRSGLPIPAALPHPGTPPASLPSPALTEGSWPPLAAPGKPRGVYCRKLLSQKTHAPHVHYSSVYSAHYSSVIIKSWEKPERPSTDKWLRKMWNMCVYIHVCAGEDITQP